ncbi:MAG: DUF3135 domain-containing protein [Pseudomonadota bacterium]
MVLTRYNNNRDYTDKREVHMPEPDPLPPRNFDAWAALASSDPEAFEQQRRQVIDHAIRQAPARRQQRLRGVQWQLDQIRASARTPMIACLHMHRMLLDAIRGENGLLDCLQKPAATLRRRQQKAATVIPLRPTRDSDNLPPDQG